MTLQTAKDLYKEGDKAQGRKVLIAHLQASPNDDLAWAYLGAKCTNLGERKYCYLKALDIAYSSTTQERFDKLAEVEPTPPPELAARPVAKKQKPAPTPSPQKSRFLLILLGGLGFAGFCLCCFCAFIGAANSPKPVATGATATPTSPPDFIATVMAFLPTSEPTATVTPTPTITMTPAPTATPTPNGSDVSAIVMCQKYVTKRLKVPDSADFGGLFDYREKATLITPEEIKKRYPNVTLKNPKGAWMVTGYVNSVNLFNVPLTSDYVCLLDFDWNNDTWFVVDFSIKQR